MKPNAILEADIQMMLAAYRINLLSSPGNPFTSSHSLISHAIRMGMKRTAFAKEKEVLYGYLLTYREWLGAI